MFTINNKYENKQKCIMVHVGVALTCAILSGIVSLLQSSDFAIELFIRFFALLYIQIEIYQWLSVKILNEKPLGIIKNYISIILTRLILFFIIILAISTLLIILNIIIGQILQGNRDSNIISYFRGADYKWFIVFYLVSILVASIIYFFMQWKTAIVREQKLKEENLQFSYQTLKNQINPHFLFNSLNTLSSMIDASNEKAENYIQGLSSIYRYILENTDNDMISLDLELDFVKKYFELQKIRLGEKIELNLIFPNPEQFTILPISVQLLVENALKHNSATANIPLVINIFKENNYLIVSNKILKKSSFELSSKLGLKNLQNRIMLMSSENMIFIEGPEEFIVKLPLISK